MIPDVSQCGKSKPQTAQQFCQKRTVNFFVVETFQTPLRQRNLEPHVDADNFQVHLAAPPRAQRHLARCAKSVDWSIGLPWNMDDVAKC